VTETTMGSDFKVGTRSFVRPLDKDEAAEVSRLTEELYKIDAALRTLRKEKSAQQELDEKINDGLRDQQLRIKSLSEGLKLQEGEFDELIRKKREDNAESEKARKEAEQIAERYRRMADPLRAYRVELEELNRVRARLGPGEFAGAEAGIRGRMVDAALSDFFGDMDRNSKIFNATEKVTTAARDMGFAFSSAFESAVIEGEKLGDVLRGLAKDLATVFLRMSITNPLLNAAFGGASGWSALPTMFGGGKADGGPVSSGTPYMVGERGPELFVPRGNGTIVPNHALGGGGDTFSFTTNVGAGVTAQQLGPILALHERNIMGKIADAKRRRTSLGAALA
jgi:hypothetical protein